MNARFSRNDYKNHPYYAISSFDEIYQLGYKHGFNDASENEDYDDDYDDEEDLDEDSDYDYGEEYERENDRRGNSARNQARDNQGRFVSSNGARSSRRASGKSESGTSRRGFASMSKAERTRIARMGGMASHGGGRTSSRAGFGGRRSS